MNRMAIAAFAACLAFAAASASAAVFNGDFEDVSGSNPNVGLVNGNRLDSLATGSSGPRKWDVFTSIPGWTTAAGRGIEVQTSGTVGAFQAESGQHYVELDSHPQGRSNSTMEQELILGPGRYLFEFSYSPRQQDSGTNGIAYSILNSATSALLAGGVTGPDATLGTQVGLWTLIAAEFVVGAGDSPLLLRFSATGAADTFGGFVDSVRVSAVPVPAALPLLFTGIAGLGLLARRRRGA